MKYMTRKLLADFLNQQDGWGYNRQIVPAAVRAVTKGQPRNTRYPVQFVMVHEHKAGVPVEPHSRCLIVLDEKGGSAMIDMPIPYYDPLPEA